MNTNPTIFIVSSERSGSNLLRVLLGNHSKLEAPIATHLLDYFRPIINKYHPISNNFNALLDDMLTMVNHKFSDWKIDSNNLNNILRTNNTKVLSLIIAYDILHKAKAEKENKAYYVIKDNHLHNHIDIILSHYKNPYFIHLYRDPRDHVTSWLKKPIYMFTPYQIVRKWKNEQKKCINLIQSGINMFPVKYEDLISNPKQIMTNVFNYVNLDWEESILNTNSDKNAKDAKKYIFWENISKPILKDNKENYLSFLSKEDICLVETLCQEEMKYLGYDFQSKLNYSFHKSKLFPLKEKYATWKLKRNSISFRQKELKLLTDRLSVWNKIKNKKIN